MTSICTYYPVHLPKCQKGYGTALINGRNVEVTEEYLNSNEAREYLETLSNQVHKGTLEFLEIVECLDRIAESKVYLCISDEHGKPLYPNFESYLKQIAGFDRTILSKMRSARNGYKWLQETFADRDATLLAKLPRNMNFYYQLEQIPEAERETALRSVVDGNNGDYLTAKRLEEWRKDTMPRESNEKTHASNEEQHPRPVEAAQVKEQPQTTDTLEPVSLETASNDVTALISESYSQVVVAVEEPIAIQPSDSKSVIDQAEDLLMRMKAGDALFSDEDFTTVLIGILQSEEYRNCLVKEKVEHTGKDGQKGDEPTSIERIEKAIEEFRKGLDEAMQTIQAITDTTTDACQS